MSRTLLVADDTSSDVESLPRSVHAPRNDISCERLYWKGLRKGFAKHDLQVREVSHDEKTARIVQTDVNWTTTARNYT